MIIIFQLIFTLVVLYAVYNVLAKKREGLLGVKGMLFWLGFWLLAGVAVWLPNSTTALANLLGIGRGADLVLYVSLIIIFYVLFKLNVKIEGLNRGVTKIVRDKAITEAPKHTNT